MSSSSRTARRSQLRQIEVARNVRIEAIIASGLKAGESVVVDGQLRLVDGAKIEHQVGRRRQGRRTENRDHDGRPSMAAAPRADDRTLKDDADAVRSSASAARS